MTNFDDDVRKALGLDEPSKINSEKVIATLPVRSKCPYCLSEINPDAFVCSICLRDQPKMSRAKMIDKENEADSQKNGLAAVLSFFIPGLGQIYKGRVLDGFAWMICVPLGYVFFIVPGVILHIWCVFKAHND